MRVLHFFKTYFPDTFGGVERTIHAIANGTRNYGVESDVLSLSKDPEHATQLVDNHMAHKSRLDFEFASTGFSRDVFQKFKFLSAAADVVHYHFPWPMMDIVHLIEPPAKPTIVTYHSDVVKQKILAYAYKPLMHRFLSRVDTIIATSPNYVETSPVLSRYRDKVDIIPIGLNQSDYKISNDVAKQYWRERFPKPFFIFVGVLRYYKGIHILLEAAANVNCDVLIVGDGPLGRELKAQAHRQHLTNVHFLGALPEEAKTTLLELSIGLVFPSHLRSEAYGLSLVEAAMFGKPMISCEIGTGTSYVNKHGTTGLVIEANNPSALAHSMNRLLNDKMTAESFGANARMRFVERFTADQMSFLYHSAYKKLLNLRNDIT